MTGREMSYECDRIDENTNKMETFVIRYRSYKGQGDFKQDVMNMTKEGMLVRKMDIGPVYDKPPSTKQRSVDPLVPLSRELIFDIDMDDYDPIRTCCEGAKVCPKCWRFLTIAVRVITRSLRQDFGFFHSIWIYSGRRGIHCWICDARARLLSNEQRGAVADYLALVTGDLKNSRINLPSYQYRHPHVKATLKISKNYFSKIILEQKTFDFSENRSAKCIDPMKAIKMYFSDEVVKWAEEQKSRQKPSQSVDFWHRLESIVSNSKSFNDKTAIEDMVLLYTYPRLDINVSKSMNHLLKSPFCVHPKSGRICVPIMFKHEDDPVLDQFNPDTVPTLCQIVRELDELGPSRVSETSLGPYLTFFDKFVANMHTDNVKYFKSQENPLSF
eukprot:GHVL01006282.1.p1 GENE.GHVL01006282.1~~GHVL01006282.1.p1  ORF type:complete len:386 (-),score=51.69 GHVL01006282.1:149-1306(-)